MSFRNQPEKSDKFARALLIVGSAVFLFSMTVSAQTLADHLGYPSGTKLIIVHADDLGETHAVNAAAIKSLEAGAVNSASLMVPCPWFPEMADYAKSHPSADFGLHLTVTSERVYYRWGSVAPADKVPSLLDENGYFHHDWENNQHIQAKEVEIELRAQVERALAMGVHPTHLDSHQYRLIINGKELFDAMLRVAHDYKLPVFVNKDWFADHPYLQESLGPEDIVLDHTVTIGPEVPPEKWAEFYISALKNLKPGVTEFVIHPGFDDEELRAATRERPTWGSAWRQRGSLPDHVPPKRSSEPGGNSNCAQTSEADATTFVPADANALRMQTNLREIEFCHVAEAQIDAEAVPHQVYLDTIHRVQSAAQNGLNDSLKRFKTLRKLRLSTKFTDDQLSFPQHAYNNDDSVSCA